ncbi:ABC transporter permease [Plantactinospora sonchi]|uniref:ABC transporter permease n=1 Tax=Plantactinospora sonchi TaxID=1544735 RepID=A0ABU7S0X1_9ACTN
MTWLAWRQFRTQFWVVLALLSALAVVLVVARPGLIQMYEDSGLATCTESCGALADSFLTRVGRAAHGNLYYLGVGAMLGLPALLGTFWGAPLVARELEVGTHRLVWNQSVTRTRWLTVKLLMGGLGSMAAAGLISLAVTWWAGPIDTAAMDRILPHLFAARGLVPMGYAAFAFAVGVTAGLLIRRTLPAMAVTLVVVAVAQLVMPFLVRPNIITPVHKVMPVDTEELETFGIDSESRVWLVGKVDEPGAWVISNETVTATGEPFTATNPEACGRHAGPRACREWVGSLNLQQDVYYQPASRFWPLQWIETALLLTIAGGLGGFCFWWLRRRLS